MEDIFYTWTLNTSLFDVLSVDIRLFQCACVCVCACAHTYCLCAYVYGQRETNIKDDFCRSQTDVFLSERGGVVCQLGWASAVMFLTGMSITLGVQIHSPRWLSVELWEDILHLWVHLLPNMVQYNRQHLIIMVNSVINYNYFNLWLFQAKTKKNRLPEIALSKVIFSITSIQRI